MKRVLVFSMAVLICAAFLALAQTTVTSVNVVGYNRTTLLPGGRYHQVAPPFDGMTTNTVMGIFGTNTVRAGISPFYTDRIFIWDVPSQSYIQIGLHSGDMQYHYLTNFSPTAPPVDPELAPGDGVWIVSVVAGSQSTVTNVMTLSGEAVAASNHQQAVVAGWQMLGVPFSCPMALTNMNFLESGATSSSSPALADRIFVWDPENQIYKQYGLKTDGWRELYPVNRWTDPTPTGDEIPMGQGFWYNANTAFVWSVNNPYIDNL